MKKLSLFLLLFALIVHCNSQTITTICGTGTAGYSGDGGQATAAEIGNEGSYLACDQFSNVFIADNSNNRIRKITPSGIISTIAGNGSPGFWADNGPATSSNFATIFGLTADGSGNVYFADPIGKKIKKISTSGMLSVIAGNGIDGWSGDGGPATAAKITRSNGITCDNQGNLYYTDSSCIRKVDTHGIITTIAGNPSDSAFSGIGGPATNARFYTDGILTVNRYRDIFFFEPYVYRIMRIDSNGIITTYVGNGDFTSAGDGGPATAASLNFPQQMGCDSFGDLIFTDVSFYKIRKVDRTTGIINSIAGNGTEGYSGDGGPATDAKLYANGLAVNKAGSIFIIDNFYNYRIRKIYYSSLGVQDVNEPEGTVVKIKPNPATNGAFKVYITTTQPEPANITVTDVTGQVLKKLDTYTNTPIDIQLNAPTGTYIVTVRTANGRWSERVEIRRE